MKYVPRLTEMVSGGNKRGYRRLLRTSMCLFWAFIPVLALALPPEAAHGEGAPPGLTGGKLGGSNASFMGEASGDRAYEVAGAGDVNGDGYDDLLVGAAGYNGDTGRVYLFLGGQGDWRLDVGLDSADAIYTGEYAGDYAGASVAGAGDVNGDGYDDLLIGAPNYAAGTGRVYLVLGSGNPAGHRLSSADATFAGESSANSRAGNTVAGAGDVNGDGYDDLLIGAFGYSNYRGRVYLVLGAGIPGDIDLGDDRFAYYHEGAADGDRAGESIAGVGDVNGDGYDDLLIGAPFFSGAMGNNQGRTYLILGSDTPSHHYLAHPNIYFDGENATDLAGNRVAGAGDVNGDGYADMLIGAPHYDTSTGRAYLVLGRSDPRTIVLYHADAIYDGENGGDHVGQDIAGAGDVNADGYDDLLIGANEYDDRYAGGNYVDWGAGGAYLVLGSNSPTSIGLGSADASYIGDEQDDYAAQSLAGVGDVNGDGYSDLLIAARYQRGTASRGKVYLLFSDFNSAEGTRYRNLQTVAHPPAEVGHSGVTVDYGDTAPAGSVYVTRHFRNTCSTNFDTNGLLWTVESQRGRTGGAILTFKYNSSQVGGWDEADLKLYYRERPCQEWRQIGNAVPEAATNRISTSSEVFAAYREYTIAPSLPSPTALGPTGMHVTLAKEPPLAVIGLAALVILATAAEWWARRMRSQERM